MRTTERQSRADMSFTGAVILSTFASIATLGIGFANSVLVARLLGPADRGHLSSLLVAATMVATLCGLGLPGANAVLVGRDIRNAGATAAQTLILSLLSAAVTSFALAIPAVRATFQIDDGLVLSMVCLYAGAATALAGLKAIVVGLQRFRLSARLTLWSSTATLSLNTVALAMLSGRMRAALVVQVAVAVGTTVVLLAAICPNPRGWLRPRLVVLKPSLAIGLRVLAANGLGYLLLRSDLLLLATMRGKDEVGHYAVAVVIAELVILVPSVLGNVLFTKAAAKEAVGARLLLAARLAALLAGAFVVALWLVGPSSFTFVFGAAYRPAYDLCFWLLIGTAAWALTTPLSGFAAGRHGYPPILIAASGMALVMNLILNLLLIPDYGSFGAAWATSIAYVAQGVLVYATLGRDAGIRLADSLRLRGEEMRILRSHARRVGDLLARRD